LVVLNQTGSLQIQLAPTPTPAPADLLLRPTHVALNHRDLFLRRALYPAPSFTTPLLADACCDVLSPAAPAAPTRRVLLNPGHGWLADPLGPEAAFSILGGTRTNPLGVAQEILAVPAAETAPCPAHLTSAEAAGLPLCGLTAWRALRKADAAAEVCHPAGLPSFLRPPSTPHLQRWQPADHHRRVKTS
jgi:NADPH:quinone reductase-like Zn-dependent oxidoreductase